MTRLTSGLFVACGVVAVVLSGEHLVAQRSDDLMLPPREAPAELCGTGAALARQLGLRPRTAAPPGGALFFRQEPAILTPDYDGPIRLREFTVAGDVESIRIRLDGQTSGEVQAFPRVARGEMGGSPVSVFEPAWPGSALGQVLRGNSWGWDDPILWWGEFLPGDSEPGNGKWIRLRILPESLPRATTVRVADDVQYSSHVVNLVLPGFGARYIHDDFGFDMTSVTRTFYRHFEDSYDGIAVVPHETYLAGYAAYHQIVRNEVRGMGAPLVDNARVHGSAGRLQAVELFNGGWLGDNASSSHEIAHQWGAYVDWARLIGLQRSGHDPQSHDPLWADRETMVGAVLAPTRRVGRHGEGWAIERVPAPALFHPMTLYAMGLIGRESVPEMTLFDEQGQFNPATSSTPAPGTPLTGPTRSATIYNVIGMLGERSGPVPAEWQRATVVVSRDQLLTPREMDYWTFIARRLSDPSGTGTVGFDGVGSFAAATGNRIALRTAIRPIAGPSLDDGPVADSPALDRRDFRDVVFDEPVPMGYRAGQRVRWTGRVEGADRSDINEIRVRLWKSDGTDADAIRIQAPVSGSSSFVIDTEFAQRQRGVYRMDVFLFWPGSGSQSSRVSITPVTID